jgi:polyisoprenoid-binding protein YceI
MSITQYDQRATETISGGWRLDPQQSSVEFRVPMLWGLLNVDGHFEDYRGRLDLSADPAIELTIDAATLQTGNARRDRHLRSADFFDAENNPQVRFVSDSVERQGDELKVRGRLSAAGHSISLELDAKVREVDGALTVQAATVAHHHELGMTYTGLGTISKRSQLSVKGRLIR